MILYPELLKQDTKQYTKLKSVILIKWHQDSLQC